MNAVRVIAQDRPDAAAAWLERLHEAAASLRRMAKRGRVVLDLGSAEFRELVVPPYRLIYRVDRARVRIVSVRHVRRRPLDADDTAEWLP
jgi:toxin ParE1/3/4